MDHPIFLGVQEDPRTDDLKNRDFRHEELSQGAPVNAEFLEKDASLRRFFSKRDQNGSSSCMAQSGAKVLGIENFVEEGKYVELSARPIYKSRINFPGEGMWQQNLFELLSKPTTCLEKDIPSQELSEEGMNSPYELTEQMKKDAEFYRSNGYTFFTNIDIQEMANVIAKGKAVHIIIYFTDSEYWKEVPEIVVPDLGRFDSNARRHGIAAVDFFLYKGERALLIEDSAGGNTSIGGKGQRIITEKFLKARCYGAGYLMYKENKKEDVVKPKVHFTVPLSFGLMHNNDVAQMQKILQYEGFLATSIDGSPLPLGNFLQMTASALKKWQVSHGLMDFANEPDVRKVRFGPRSIALANTLYA